MTKSYHYDGYIAHIEAIEQQLIELREQKLKFYNELLKLKIGSTVYELGSDDPIEASYYPQVVEEIDLNDLKILTSEKGACFPGGVQYQWRRSFYINEGNHYKIIA